MPTTDAPRATLDVVAARAGVSRATASRVLRGASNVSEQARAAVLQAAQELSYTVNRAARSLVTRRSESVGFLVAESEDRMFSDPYFLSVLRGAQAEIGAANLQLVFAVAATREETAQFQAFAAAGHVDGVLLVSLHGDDELPRALEALGVPTVLNGRPLAGGGALYCVDSDNLAGGRQAVEVLLRRGCRCVATIAGPLDMGVGQDRLAGYRQALARARLPADPRLVAEGDFTAESGTIAMRRLLADAPELDGVFAASDLMALGAMQELDRQGRRVPEDVAVIGFDDIRPAALSTPPLSTVRQPIDRLGRTMATVLLARLRGAEPDRMTVLPTEVVLRASA
jgi:DNA-binding LacI/PurR family transcriptional regulator